MSHPTAHRGSKAAAPPGTTTAGARVLPGHEHDHELKYRKNSIKADLIVSDPSVLLVYACI